MANKFKRVKGIETRIRLGATAFSITSQAGTKGETIDLRAASKEDLASVAQVVCQLHGIRAPQKRVGGKFVR